MAATTTRFIELCRRQNLPLRDMRGATLRVVRGRLWITQESDTRDLVLEAGDSWAIERNGLTIVEAQADTSLVVSGRNLDAIRSTQRTSSPLSPLWRRVRAAFALMMLAPPRRTLPYF